MECTDMCKIFVMAQSVRHGDLTSHRLHMQNVEHRKCDIIGICLTLAVGAAEAVGACTCVAAVVNVRVRAASIVEAHADVTDVV